MKKEPIRKQFTTPIFLVSYPKFDKPNVPPTKPGEEPKDGSYECVAIFNDATRELDKKYNSQSAWTLEMVEQLIGEITKKVNGDYVPTEWRIPLKDGREKSNTKDAALYEGGKYVRLHNKNKFVCLDINKQVLDVADRAKCYGGMYGRAIITVMNYDNIGKGITAYMDAFQKVEDGEPLGGGGINAVEAFDDLNNAAEAVSSEDLSSLL